MNSFQIDTVLDISLSKKYGGIYAADRLPQMPHSTEKPVGFVANTDNHDSPGQHWVAFYFPVKGPSEYFDSYGLPPWKSQFLKFLGMNYIKNNYALQSSKSDVCGQYCIMYLMLRANNYTQNEILSLFSTNTQQNDAVVDRFYNSLRISFPLQRKQTFSTCQTCLERNRVEIPWTKSTSKPYTLQICC